MSVATFTSSTWNAVLDAIKRIENVSGGGNLYGVTDGHGSLLPSQGEAADRHLAGSTLAALISKYGSVQQALIHYGEPCNQGATVVNGLRRNSGGNLCGEGYAAWVLGQAGAGIPVASVPGSISASQPQAQPSTNLMPLLVLGVAAILGFILLIDLLKPAAKVAAFT